MSAIWFSSDFHYAHRNLVRGTTSWGKDPTRGQASVERTRDFDTLEKHDNTLVNNINKVVMPNDIMYFLGDWSFGGHENVRKFRERIMCSDIRLIYGNHDDSIKESEEYQKLFTSCKIEDLITINGQWFYLHHLPARTWYKQSRGCIALHGHCHGTLEPKIYGKSKDVGIDCSRDFRPFHINEILQEMKNRDIKIVDHH